MHKVKSKKPMHKILLIFSFLLNKKFEYRYFLSLEKQILIENRNSQSHIHIQLMNLILY